MEVLEGEAMTWQQSNPHKSDLLRRNGTKEAPRLTTYIDN